MVRNVFCNWTSILHETKMARIRPEIDGIQQLLSAAGAGAGAVLGRPGEGVCGKGEILHFVHYEDLSNSRA